MPRYFLYCFYSFFIVGIMPQGVLLQAQELEPRLLSNIPVKSNVLAVGYGYASGNILLDPAVPLEDFNARSINFFGMSGKIDVVVPFSAADWTGTYQGNYEESSRTGFGDIRMRFSFNFLGAPPISLEELKEYIT